MKQIIAAALVALMAIPASGQEQCGERAAVTIWLAEEYGESLQTIGISQAGFVETWANIATGSFTIILTQGDVSCMVAAGGGFARVDHDPAPQGERM